MGLFDIFKRKTRSDSENENPLEALLRQASTESAYRAEFYRRLLTDKLIVMTEKTGLPEGSRTLQKDAQINIVSFNGGKIPVFTSQGKLYDNGILKVQVSILAMKGEDLFNLAKGATFILNPYSNFGKELLPNEIESMLNNTIFTDSHNKIVIQKNTPVLISQPINYPIDIINSLNLLFSTKPTVKKAYLGWISNPSSGEPPHYIFALDIEGEAQAITNEAGFTVKQLLKPEDIVDFIQIDDKEGLSSYFVNQTEPFFERTR